MESVTWDNFKIRKCFPWDSIIDDGSVSFYRDENAIKFH